MDLEQELLREHSKHQTLKIAAWIGADRERLDLFMKMFFSGEPIIVQRGAWVISIVGDTHPELLQPYLKRLVAKMKQPGVHAAVKRNVVRLLQTIDIPRTLLGTVTTLCFDFLASPKETIAVKACSITVLAKIARREPDLMKELRLLVDQQLPSAGGAIRSRARNLLHMSADEG
jgi:hypothetical protein